MSSQVKPKPKVWTRRAMEFWEEWYLGSISPPSEDADEEKFGVRIMDSSHDVVMISREKWEEHFADHLGMPKEGRQPLLNISLGAETPLSGAIFTYWLRRELLPIFIEDFPIQDWENVCYGHVAWEIYLALQLALKWGVPKFDTTLMPVLSQQYVRDSLDRPDTAERFMRQVAGCEDHKLGATTVLIVQECFIMTKFVRDNRLLPLVNFRIPDYMLDMMPIVLRAYKILRHNVFLHKNAAGEIPRRRLWYHRPWQYRGFD